MINNKFLNVWNHSHQKHFHGQIIYDDWLEKSPFNKIIKTENGLYLDLGCGQGNDTLFLVQKNKNVISCDLSDEAVKIVTENISGSNVMQLDMSLPMPFDDDKFNVVISDFSLQYFNTTTTKNIIKELKRILKNEGYLILRLSSINDINYGAMMGDMIEKHFYFVEKRNKRYYDDTDIRMFFKDWDILFLNELRTKLIRYDYERSYFEVLLKNRK